MNPLDLRVYLVTDPSYEALLDRVAAAVQGGVTLVQLRDKHADDDAVVATAAALREVLGDVPLILNDRPDLVQRAGAAGVHVGRKDASPATARKQVGTGIVGWSASTPEDLDDPQVQHCDYLAASPVWTTATKADHSAPLGIDGVTVMRRRTALPLVAIGGIDVDRAGHVVRAGADGVAGGGGILRADDPAAAARAYRVAVDDALTARAAR